MGGGGEVMWTKSKRTAIIPHETVPNSRTKFDHKTQVYKGSPPPKCFVKRGGDLLQSQLLVNLLPKHFYGWSPLLETKSPIY